MTFNKRIVIQREVRDGEGSFAKKEWKPIGTIHANWQNAFGSELWAAESAQAKKPATVTVRYNAFKSLGVDETCRIVFGDTIYKIVDAHDVQERHIKVEIKVEAVVNG